MLKGPWVRGVMWHDGFVCFIIICKEVVHCESPQTQSSKQPCRAVPRKNNRIFLMLSGVSGAAGLHVSCVCISVYFSPQQGPSTQTIQFRIRLWFRFWEQSALRGTTSLSHTASASLPCMGGCSVGAGRSEPAGQPPLPENFIVPAAGRAWKSFWRITNGKTSKFRKRDSFGRFFVIIFLF